MADEPVVEKKGSSVEETVGNSASSNKQKFETKPLPRGGLCVMATKVNEADIRGTEKFLAEKERRKSSSSKMFQGDYLNLANSRPVQKLMASNSDKEVCFSDIVIKVNKRNKMQERIFLITENAIYNIDPNSNKCKRKIPLRDVGSVSLSRLADNFFALHVPKEYDYLLVSSKKTEIVCKLIEVYERITKSPLPVKFSNRFDYRTPETEREILFKKVDGGVSTQIYVKPKGKK